MNSLESSILRWLTVILIPLVLGLLLFVSTLWRDFSQNDALENGFVTPTTNLNQIIDYVKSSTVTVNCKNDFGSGFSFEFEKADKAKFNFELPDNQDSSVILTNYHVVKECFKDKSEIYISDFESKRLKGIILEVDSDNDVAAIWVPKEIESLLAAPYTYYPGFWVMAMGSPFGMTSSVTFGNIIYIENSKIYTSASLNKGNSGGPLVDNTGYVMAINTGYRAVAQNLNYATDINVLCAKLAKCEKDYKLIHSVAD